MRTALKRKATARQQIDHTKTVPAPVGGWNARDALAAMPVTDAVVLDNFMPKDSFVELRGGHISHTTEAATDLTTESGSDLTTETGDLLTTEDTFTVIAGTVKTLAPYNRLAGFNALFALTNQGIYDVTFGGVAGASLLARTNGKHQYQQFGDGTTNWLIAVNGSNDPAYYNGTSWQAVDETTTPALTGYTGNAVDQFVDVNQFKGRLFFIPRDSLEFWYLPPSVAGGALLKFDLTSQCPNGGYLLSMGTWTRDAGDGMDDLAVFVTSEGDVIVYQGTNPSNANSWAKIGSFYVGKPLGRRCLTQYGGDMVILTENGAYPLSTALLSGSINYVNAISTKIERAFTDAARSSGATFGWEAILYPSQQALIVNVPVTEDGTHYQYVMNTNTRAWCRFLGWNAETFVVFNKELYFARGPNVYKAWIGAIDGSNNIEGYGKQAFSNFGTGQLKSFKLFRPLLSVNGSLDFLTDIDVDFQDDTMIGTTTASAGGAGIWNQSQWNQALWAGGLKTVKPWTSIAEWPGVYAAGKVKVATNTRRVQWMASDFIFELGGVL